MNRKAIILSLTALALSVNAVGCSGGARAVGTDEAAASTVLAVSAETSGAGGQELAVIEDQLVPLYSKPAGSYVRTPIASGTVTYGNNLAKLDASNTAEGYIMLKYLGSNPKIKV